MVVCETSSDTKDSKDLFEIPKVFGNLKNQKIETEYVSVQGSAEHGLQTPDLDLLTFDTLNSRDPTNSEFLFSDYLTRLSKGLGLIFRFWSKKASDIILKCVPMRIKEKFPNKSKMSSFPTKA